MYHYAARGGVSHGHMLYAQKNFVNIGHVVPKI